MHDIALRRLRVLPITRGPGLGQKRVLMLLAELAELGYRVSNPELLASADLSALSRHDETMRTLAAMRGGDVQWVPLFTGFPDRVPEENEYFARRIVGYLGAMFDMFRGERLRGAARLLETGVTVPEWLFDLDEFGADPVTQMQTRELFEKGAAHQAAREGDTHTEWISLELVWADELDARLTGWMTTALYANSSLKEGVRSDLARALAHLGPDAIDPAQISQKETLAFALRVYWNRGDADALVSLTRAATDLLRLFALLTDTDVSLATTARFPKFSRAQRRMALAALESCAAGGSLAEDLNRHRGLWLSVARGLHVGEYAARFPLTAAAFAQLRAGRIPSFASVTQAHIAAGDVPALLAHLRRRPGVFARHLHELLRRFPDQIPATLSAFDAVSDRVPAKSLLVLDAHLSSINDRAERAVVNKRGAMKILSNPTQGALTPSQLAAARVAVEAALLRRFAALETLDGQTVYVDPALAHTTVPLQQRAASDGLITLGRGSRIGLDMDKVLRLFVYWKQRSQRTDLDLSVAQFDTDLRFLGHVSYTRLKGAGIVHSGDLQSAPHGAAEFIDVTLSELPEGVRYLAIQVYRYAGEAFPDLAESYAGWMIREQATGEYKSFDPKTVANGYALRGRGAYAFPLVVDLERQQVVLTDLFMSGRAMRNTVEGALGNVTAAVRQIADFTQTRPTLGRLAELHVRARGGELVDDTSADVSFGFDGCTFDVRDAERVLAELI